MHNNRLIVWIVLADLMAGLWAVEHRDLLNARVEPGGADHAGRMLKECKRERDILRQDREAWKAKSDSLAICEQKLKEYQVSLATSDACTSRLASCEGIVKRNLERTGATPELIRVLCSQLELSGFSPSCDTKRGIIAIDAAAFGFDTDSSEIPALARDRSIALGAAITEMLEHHGNKIRYVLLSAHADCRGAASHNMRLSQDRAFAIWDAWRREPRLAGYFDPPDEANGSELLDLGSRVVVGGFGEGRATRVAGTQNLAHCDSRAAEDSRDRRIELEVIPATD